MKKSLKQIMLIAMVAIGTMNLNAQMKIVDSKVGIGLTSGATPNEKLQIDGWIGRTSHSNGALLGSYNNVGANSSYTNPIYVIGSNYKPSASTLSNMYGVGYTHTNASFISTPSHVGWGLYVAADGDARIFLNASSNGDSYFNAGKVGIGTTNPTHGKVQVNGEGVNDGICIHGSGSTFRMYRINDVAYITRAGNNNYGITIKNNGNVGIGKIADNEYKLDVAGVINTTHYYTESDIRFKKDIKTYKSDNNDLYNLRPVTYKLKSYPKIVEYSEVDTIPNDSLMALGLPSTGTSGKRAVKTIPYDSRFKEKYNRERQEIGFIAQEIKEIYPDLVMENDQGYLSVNYIGLIPIMVDAMKEQQLEIDEQKKKLDAQQKQIDELYEMIKALKEK